MLKRNRRSASIRLSLNQNGELSVTAPYLAPKFLIDRFVAQNQEWINRQQQRLQLRQSANPNFDWQGKLVSYLGQLYSIKVTTDPGPKVSFGSGKCWVRPITGLESDARKTLIGSLKVMGEKYLLERTNFWANQMKLKFGTVRFGQQTSRWGSCTGDNNLRFNWRLIHFPSEVIDYVVIHELAHTQHHDHSDRFWKLVAQYCPQWKDQRKFLKRQSVATV